MAPRPALPCWEDRAITEARVGPMQGVQPMPNSAPSSGAPSRPMVGLLWKRNSRWVIQGIRPMKKTPMRIMSTPSTLDSTPWFSWSVWPK
ncbi:hypothetical protein RKD46_003729 [Streptomyces pseudovenezuelae]